MNLLRYYVGACLIVVARTAIQAAKGLEWVGRAVMPKTGANGAQRASVSRPRVIVSHTMRLRNGQNVTLYGIRRR